MKNVCLELDYLEEAKNQSTIILHQIMIFDSIIYNKSEFHNI